VGLTALLFSPFATRAHAQFVGEPSGSGPFPSIAESRKELPGSAADALSQRALDMNRVVFEAPPARTNELAPGAQPPASITEHTTHHLTTSKT